MRKNFACKKAVSPVIATVLMILVTMVGMTLLFAFVTSYSETYKEGVGSQVLELLTVEDIYLSPGKTYANDAVGTVQISVYNAGKVDSQITSVYVNGLSASATASGSDFNLVGKTVAVGEHLTFTVFRNNYWQPGQTYTFTIGTKTGSTFDVTYTAP